MGNGRLRLGIAGRRGGDFLSGLRALPQVEVVALCDTDAQVLREQAEKHGIPRRFTRFAEMLDAVDAVVVATPMQLHVPQASSRCRRASTSSRK